MELVRIDLYQRARQEIRLFLVVAFQRHAVAGLDQGFQCLHDSLWLEKLALGVRSEGGDTACLGLAQAGPGTDGDGRIAHSRPPRAPTTTSRRTASRICACRQQRAVSQDAAPGKSPAIPRTAANAARE